MDMKRREFVLKMGLIFLPSSLGLLQNKAQKNASQNTKAPKNLKTITSSGTFYFPKNPEIISSILYIDIKKSDEITFKSSNHKINRENQDLCLIGPKKCTAQYLGEDYGWSII